MNSDSVVYGNEDLHTSESVYRANIPVWHLSELFELLDYEILTSDYQVYEVGYGRTRIRVEPDRILPGRVQLFDLNTFKDLRSEICRVKNNLSYVGIGVNGNYFS